MRVAQLIDSLEAGGAERIAVNYANALGERYEFSGLIATRGEGSLRKALNKEVSYLFLKKKYRLDISALSALYQYCRYNKISILHAHSTSIFLAVLVKILLPKLKIIWHDHYGNSDFINRRPTLILKILLKFCGGAIAVNSKLEHWIRYKLNFNNVIYLPNFVEKDLNPNLITTMKGNAGKRILCLANLRHQKNHVLLLKVAARVKKNYPEWSFHFVGKDFHDEISQNIRNSIIEHDLNSTVFLYGSCTDIAAIIECCEIGVLSSNSEGMPLAILEYGLHSKAVVSTDVGEISKIISNRKNGFLVKSDDENELYNSIIDLIVDKTMRDKLGNELNKTILMQYSANFVIEHYIKWIKKW